MAKRDKTKSDAHDTGADLAIETFMRTFGAFVERTQHLTDPKVQLADAVLQAHLGPDASKQPVVSESFSPWDHINITRALRALEPMRCRVDWKGLVGDLRYLRSLGQHLKRGVLLHGAPGAGKTMTVRYLASHLADSTVIVLTGVGLRAHHSVMTDGPHSRAVACRDRRR